MKEIIKKAFIAEDGTSFGTKKECICYEEELNELLKIGAEKEKQKKHLKGIEVKEAVTLRPCNGEDNNESHFWSWYKVKNQADVDAVNSIGTCSLDFEKIEVKSFPEYLCVEKDDWGTEVFITTLSESIEYMTFLFEKFGLQTTITAKNKGDCENDKN